MEQVQTPSPEVHQGWDAVKVAAGAVGTGAAVVAGIAAGGAVIAGGSVAAASLAGTAATVATRAGAVETVAAIVDAKTGGPTTPGEVVAIGTATGILGAASSKTVAATLGSTANKVLAPTGLDAALDVSLTVSRNAVHNFGAGTAAASATAVGIMLKPSIEAAVNDSYQQHFRPEDEEEQ